METGLQFQSPTEYYNHLFIFISQASISGRKSSSISGFPCFLKDYPIGCWVCAGIARHFWGCGWSFGNVCWEKGCKSSERGWNGRGRYAHRWRWPWRYGSLPKTPGTKTSLFLSCLSPKLSDLQCFCKRLFKGNAGSHVGFLEAICIKSFQNFQKRI